MEMYSLINPVVWYHEDFMFCVLYGPMSYLWSITLNEFDYGIENI